ncbi:MAG: type VI secretion system tube protein Hcp [Chthoniobacterales bacterium]|nr:type VI secretion system tube protein Hcp [Chthoniobacterales bacterium]
MASDYFLKIQDIEGESQDSAHKNEIDIISFNFEAAQPTAGGTLSGVGAGRVQVGTFNFVSRQSKASPKLMLACCDGTHIPTVTLTIRKAGKEQQEFSVYKLSDCIITSYKVESPNDDSGIPLDTFKIGFSKIEHTYKEQKTDGTLGGSVQAGWDVKANKAV